MSRHDSLETPPPWHATMWCFTILIEGGDKIYEYHLAHCHSCEKNILHKVYWQEDTAEERWEAGEDRSSQVPTIRRLRRSSLLNSDGNCVQNMIKSSNARHNVKFNQFLIEMNISIINSHHGTNLLCRFFHSLQQAHPLLTAQVDSGFHSFSAKH